MPGEPIQVQWAFQIAFCKVVPDIVSPMTVNRSESAGAHVLVVLKEFFHNLEG